VPFDFKAIWRDRRDWRSSPGSTVPPTVAWHWI